MAPPRAADNFGQKQSITTAIRNICEYYPPNTCLRELLQNADDAGATEIEYVLDTKTYGRKPLLAHGLEEFQGPALLARNNSVFRDEDFNGLSTVGDSVKAKDPTTTGKFGQGFNATYHWSDGPWIWSRNWLLILDPHEWWSRETGQAGGPRWDVVENCHSPETQNHLETFNAFNLNKTQTLNQTVIRIPLRTSIQATRSKIFSVKVEIKQIRQALEEFSEEIKEGGLLFLKHVRKVIIRVDSDVMLETEVLRMGEKDMKAKQQLPGLFKGLYASDVPLLTPDISLEFELQIRHRDKKGSLVNRYVVQHLLMRSSGDVKLDEWGREHKLFPWVAIAAPLKDDYKTQLTHGRLFTTLRLPMHTNLPLHIHGLFSIAPDRGRLSFTRDLGDMPTQWNKFMFTRCVTSAWLQLLARRNCISWQEEGFSFWPMANFTPVEVWDRLDDSVIDLAISSNSRVWNTTLGGCVDFSTGFLASKNNQDVYGSALAQANVPAVYLGDPLLEKVKQRAGAIGKEFKPLTPRNVRHFLRSNGMPVVSSPDTSLILEFCLLDALKSQTEGNLRRDLYQDLQDIAYWPTLNGAFSASGNIQLLLPRDNAEMELFSNSRASNTLDISRLRPAVRKQLYNDIEYLTAVMRLRGLDDLKKDWPNMYPIAHNHCSQSWAERPLHLDQLLGEVWEWIVGRRRKGQLLSRTHSGSLWLVPMNNGGIRQYVPGSESHPLLLIEQGESLFQPLAGMIAQLTTAAAPVLDIQVLSSEVVQFIRDDRSMRADMNCTTIDDIEKVVAWLVAGKVFVSQLSEQNRDSLTDHIERLTRDHLMPNDMSSVLKSSIRQLPLFSKRSCVSPFNKISCVMCSLDTEGHVYATPADLPPMPDLPNAAFFEPQSTAQNSLIQRLQALETVSRRELFNRHFWPWMVGIPAAVDNPLNLVKEAVIDWLIKGSLPSSSAWASDVFAHSIIPLPVHGRQRRYRCLEGMVDPDSELAQFYDVEEGLFPCSDFVAKHKVALLAYGLLSSPLWSTPLERIRYFSKHEGRLDLQKAEKFLKLPVPTELIRSEASIAEIRRLKWLPGTSITGQPVILAPIECRGAEDNDLVDLVLGTTSVNVKKTSKWKRVLGWDHSIDSNILIKQLDGCLANKNNQKANAVLRQLRPEDCPNLLTRSWILGRSGKHFPPSRVFSPGNELIIHPLTPYLDQIDGQFAREHEHLLKTSDIEPEPSIKHLQEVNHAIQGALEEQLDPQSIQIAISILEIATHLKYDCTDLLVPDTSSRLRKLADVVHGDPLVLGDKPGFNLTHPKISLDLIRRLKIEDSRERAIRLEFDLESDCDEDYIPCERFETTISDTLSRYSIADTFNEFLANADDADASKIVWIVDECKEGHYPSSSLLSRDLHPLQGPSLFVYNDSEFSKKDFDGFKDIGQGGKKGDDESTGMFGRGAQSLYHFTDVPMLVSNDAFVILDPRRQVLPFEVRRRDQRRVGIKTPLNSVNRLAPDQLKPFTGLYDFDPNNSNYNGTIFRFPLRPPGAQTSLKETQQAVDLVIVKHLLDSYLVTARTAMVFLRHIKVIEFQIRGRPSSEWIVSAQHFRSNDSGIFRRSEITTAKSGSEPQKDTWLIGLKTSIHVPPEIVRSGKGSKKQTECGVAACLDGYQHRRAEYKVETEPELGMSLLEQSLNSAPKSAHQPAIRPEVFCRLPTVHQSTLPISFHASFAMTGDRRSIPLETSAENSAWNLWLLRECISGLYLEAVLYLASILGLKAFYYWPAQDLSTTLSGTLSKSFWEKLSKPEYSSRNLLPISVENTKKEDTIDQDYSQKTTSLGSARFDFLLKHTSEELQPLLKQIIPLLVRPPQRLWPSFRGSSVSRLVQQVTPEYLCEVFKVEANCQLLERFIADTGDKSDQEQVLALLLRTMVPRIKLDDPNTLEVLDRCRVVPRPGLNHPMGTLVWKPNDAVQWNLVPNPEEEDLFVFAADTMVHNGLFPQPKLDLSTTIHHDPVHILLQGDFNVRPLQLSDIGSLLGRPDSPIAPSAKSEVRDVWIVKFWRYLNPKLRALYDLSDHSVPFFDETVETLLSKSNLHDQPIYRVQRGQHWIYITPEEFQAKPYILRPLNKHHQLLCESIPGLAIIDHDCAPFLLRDQECNLDCDQSFKRLLQAIGKLEKTNNTAAKTFMGQTLTPELKDIMKDLALKFLKSGPYDPYSSDVILRRLPIWRRQEPAPSPPREHVAAEDALFCNFAKMLMPWVSNLSRFVRPELIDFHRESLSKLDIAPLTHSQMWDIIKSDVPAEVKSEGSRQQYLEFIQYLSQWNLQFSGRVAPNGSSVMCEATSFYDHQDEVFQAAFREQQNVRFLHKDMRKPGLRKFWLSLGLRARSGEAIRPDHYLECAEALGRRWNSSFTTPDYEEDSKKVALYLEFDGHQFRSWPSAAWTKLASIPMFKVSIPNNELEHRQDRMLEIARQATHLALEGSAHIKYKRILWSQSCFLQKQPGDFVYETLPQRGKPDVTTVFYHIQYLVQRVSSIKQSEVAEYLRDIQASYEYIQGNLEATKRIGGIHKARIWLNLNTTQVELATAEALEASLTSTDLLCLNSLCDPLPLKTARPFLIPYERLLVGLGCKSVIQPTPASQPQSSDSREHSLAAAMGKMRQLRDHDLLVDVYFEAEGQKKPAHKIVLAAVSEYCKAQFAGPWGRVLKDQATICIEDLSYLTVSQMVDFAYSGDFQGPELKNSNDLDEIGRTLETLLNLLEGTDRWVFQRLHEMVENFMTSAPYCTIYVRVDTVEWVKTSAESARATRLVKYCEEFFRDNEEIVVALRDG